MTPQYDETISNLNQRIGELESMVETMTLSRTDAGLDAMALNCAQAVEDLFAQHHEGGRSQRLARMQVLIRESIRLSLTGKQAWDFSSYVRNVKVPT